jgi:hypothetical protein
MSLENDGKLGNSRKYVVITEMGIQYVYEYPVKKGGKVGFVKRSGTFDFDHYQGKVPADLVEFLKDMKVYEIRWRGGNVTPINNLKKE